MSDHDAIAELLLEHAGDAPLSDEVRAHLESCAECRALADTIGEVDAGVRSMIAPPLPGDLIARTLERVAEPPVKAPPSVLALLLGLISALLGGLWTMLAFPFRTPRARAWTFGVTVPALAVVGLAFVSVSFVAYAPVGDAGPVPRVLPPLEPPEPEVEEVREGRDGADDGVETRVEVNRPGYSEAVVLADGRDALQPGAHTIVLTPDDQTVREGDFHTVLERATVNGTDDDGDGTSEQRRHEGRDDRGRNSEADRRGELSDLEQLTRSNDLPVLPPTELEGLTFQEPRGYWANTYVPGDPILRTLRRRLADTPAARALAERAEPIDLGLDPPREGALSLSVRADRASVEGRSRLIVAVGLRGAAVRGGRRATLATAVVVDARRPLDESSRARVRELLSALSRGREGGDRISVIVAGPHGGVLVPPGELRFGELSVALDRLESGASALALDAAVRAAIESVGGEDAPLGSALVLLATPGLEDADARAIEPLAHAGALGGVATSAVALNGAVDLEVLGRVALAGQGRRAVLASPDDADRVVAGEVEAASRTVARAARLNIRLAAGASLVGVLGSHRLDAVDASRVREAESAIDRQLARELGIASDRGEDEDGIQIVIPAFLANDQHVVLLDLVVEGPGAIADVSLRWKDLVRAGNGSASDRLTLGEGGARRGPRERAVVLAYAAHELAEALRESAELVRAGHSSTARGRLWAVQQRIASVEGMADDVALCEAYRAALGEGEGSPAIADSLAYASARRIQGDPLALEVERRARPARPSADPPAMMDTVR